MLVMVKMLMLMLMHLGVQGEWYRRQTKRQQTAVLQEPSIQFLLYS